ncbi:MAG: hypothetical protein V7735_14790 [Photobacterium frigidiphilum]|uniref:hypothetical protein n=1 Tax=Photobacterium frigidiphilum TaxID=264736 RepID=UPI00300266C0
MGLFDKVFSWGERAINFVDRVLDSVDNSSSSSANSSVRTYEPDKLKMAEIEQQTQLIMADKEAERIELMTQAKIEIVREEGNFQIALERARLHGLEQTFQLIEQMRDRVTEVARLRIEIIGSGTLSVIKDAEQFYKSLEEKLHQDESEFYEKRLPLLFVQLEKFAPDSAARNSYQQLIDNLINSQIQRNSDQLRATSERLHMVIASINQTKDSITAHTNAIEATLVNFMLSESSQREKIGTELRQNTLAYAADVNLPDK